jgi:hypothetical protein
MAQKKTFVALVIFIFCAAGVALYTFWPFDAGLQGLSWPFSAGKPQERHRTRVIVPGATDSIEPLFTESTVQEENYSLKAPMNEGEYVVSVFNFDFNFNAIEEQVVAYKNTYDPESPVSIAFFAFDERSGSYQRQWNAATAAIMPGTVTMYSMDLLGDRCNCIIVSGMNSQREYTLTVFYKSVNESRSLPY